jgi:hypothetical protein
MTRGYHSGPAEYSSVLGCFVVSTVDSSLPNTAHQLRIRESGSVGNNIGKFHCFTVHFDSFRFYSHQLMHFLIQPFIGLLS